MKSCFAALRAFVFALAFAWPVAGAYAQASGVGEIREKDIPIQVTEVAPGLYFQYHHQESNSAFFVTDEGVLVIDTRSAEQYAGGHIPGAINVPLSAWAEHLPRLKAAKKPIVAYCA